MFLGGMPLFEYLCSQCGNKFVILVGMTAQADDESCPRCGSRETKRLVSRFARGKTEDDRIEELSDRLEAYGDPESPAEMRRMAREVGKALDEDSSDELEEMLEGDLEGDGEEAAG